MDHQIFYKFITNYRSILHLPKVDICNLMKNAEGNLFLSKPLLAFKAAFPNAEFNCPFKVKTLINLIFAEYLVELISRNLFYII